MLGIMGSDGNRQTLPAMADHVETALELESLLDETSLGRKDAFSLLYRATSSSVYGFALSLLKNVHDAEDVMQDTFLQIYANAGLYQHRGKPMAWILTIVRNLCFMKMREGKRIVLLPEFEEAKDSWDDGMEGDILNLYVLRTAMEVLTEEERAIVILHALADCRHREIAEILDIPLSTALAKYHRALKKLKMKIEGDEQNEKER